ESKRTRRIARNTIIPTNPREAEAEFVNNIRREVVHEACACDLCRIGIVSRERDRNQRCREVATSTLRIKSIDRAEVSWRPVYLEVFLVIGDETGLWSLKIILNQSIRRGCVWCWIERGMTG